MKSKFFAFLEKARSYPDEKKRLIGFAVSGVLTFFIVSANFVIPGAEVKKIAEVEPDRNVASPFSMVTIGLSHSFSDIKNAFPTKEALNRIVSGITKSIPAQEETPPISESEMTDTATTTVATSTASF